MGNMNSQFYLYETSSEWIWIMLNMFFLKILIAMRDFFVDDTFCWYVSWYVMLYKSDEIR